ncbi:MAG TPA: 50S ribosomal protein L23 [Smithellaceae bacterium]|jgi:large subunit ribosomal protein L23|nr:50S ribosomal protein L23 [Syntrophaceae bacterium]NMC92727.1 50S ribosomal protein L23 [Smithella sp.]OQC73993.1 MAG: 50S ribosomal protein L23 [Deltaproteobacteria bacterium ADurb.Bin002]HNV55844.1 50S ribosomal protein L23 [Smithellaceae bacterium]MBP8665503.1 50S ribosomal protein L23 [Syntrophaceae bacterium]
MELHQVIRKMLLTEKSNLDREAANKYHFEVDRRANKVEIGQAVEKLFKVKVTEVRVIHVLGKKKRMGRVMGKKSDWKKAIVTLAEGSRIEVAEGV